MPRKKSDKVCCIEGCGGKHRAKGYCDKHYKRLYKHGSPFICLPRRTPQGPNPKLLRMWRSSLSGTEIAAMFGVARVTVYATWWRARQQGLLPPEPRPQYGF